MASWMVHLRIADEILKRMEGLDETAFVIGNIAPDSGVPNEDWSKYFPPKNVSHFKTRLDDELSLMWMSLRNSISQMRR